MVIGCEVLATLPPILLLTIIPTKNYFYIKPNYFKKQIFYHHFYLPEVNIQVQNDHGRGLLSMGAMDALALAILKIGLPYFRE
jgi:hypothetical protein